MGPAQDLSNVVLDGRYRLTRLLGVGGMGQVYEGMHETLDRKVAVKVLLPRYAYEARYRERFLREAKAASKVRHPNVVQIIDFGDTPNGSVYFAMEFLEGRDLATVLREQGRLPWPQARHLLLQIASALAAAHEHKIIHRDIKPGNFFIIDARGHQQFIKVLDFGIAKITTNTGDDSDAQSLTGTGEVFGTAKYMAPEQAYGYSDDPRVDVYSVGVVAYEMLTGQVPFSGVSTFDIISRHVSAPPPPPRTLEPSIPPAVEAIILRALAKRQEDRFASMDEMGQALAAVPDGPGAPAYAPPKPSESLSHAVPPIASPFGHSSAAPGMARPAAVPPQEGTVVAPAMKPPASGSPIGTFVPPSAPPRAAGPPGSAAGASARQKPAVGSRPTTPQSPAGGPSRSEPSEPQHGPGSGPTSAPPTGPEPGTGTSIVPTQMRPPAPMAYGDYAAGSSGTGPSPSTGTEAIQTDDSSGPAMLPPTGPSEELVLQGATTVMPNASESVTSSVSSNMPLAYDTDSHGTYPDPAEAPPSKRGLVLGLVGALAVGGLVLAVWGASGDDEPVPSAAAADGDRSPESSTPQVIVAKTPTPEPTSASDAPPVGSTPEEPANPDPEPTTDPEPTDPSPEPADPEPADPDAAATPKRKPSSEPAPLTDKKVRWRLARKLKKKCKDSADGPVTIELLVGSTGSVLSKNMRGVSSGLKRCLTEGLGGVKFPEGKTRTVNVKVDF